MMHIVWDNCYFHIFFLPGCTFASLFKFTGRLVNTMAFLSRRFSPISMFSIRYEMYEPSGGFRGCQGGMALAPNPIMAL